MYSELLTLDHFIQVLAPQLKAEPKGSGSKAE